MEIPLPDGDRLIGFYLQGSSDLVVYLFHGLSGSTEGDYIRRTAQVAQSLGHSVLMMNHRGCGDGAGLAQGPYHSGRAEDISAVLDWGKEKFKKHKSLVVGFSLSGNALLLLLSGKRGSTQPDYAVSVNAPINLESAALQLKQGLNRIYDLRFVLECRRAIPRTYQVPVFSTLHDFDNLYTAPAGGFKNREDYYRTCSTKNLLSEIKTPTVILTAGDDPFVNAKDYEEAKLSPFVHLHIEPTGGHMGYLSRIKTPYGTHRWLDYALNEAMKALV
jgi:predicted alpha/beta-fold hydrolase